MFPSRMCLLQNKSHVNDFVEVLKELPGTHLAVTQEVPTIRKGLFVVLRGRDLHS